MKVIDETYGHLARDTEAAILARLNARGGAEREEAGRLADDMLRGPGLGQ